MQIELKSPEWMPIIEYCKKFYLDYDTMYGKVYMYWKKHGDTYRFRKTETTSFDINVNYDDNIQYLRKYVENTYYKILDRKRLLQYHLSMLFELVSNGKFKWQNMQQVFNRFKFGEHHLYGYYVTIRKIYENIEYYEAYIESAEGRKYLSSLYQRQKVKHEG